MNGITNQPIITRIFKASVSQLIVFLLIFYAFPAIVFNQGKALAFEATSTTFEIHGASINSISGSSTAGTTFILQQEGGGTALGLSIISPFKLFSGILNWFFALFTNNYDQNHFRWRNNDGGEAPGSSQTVTLHPTSQGNYTGYTATGCTEDTGEWDCVNDQTSNAGTGAPEAHDSLTTNLNIVGAALSSFGLDNDTIPAGSTITQLEIFMVLRETSNAGTGPSFHPFYRLNAADTPCGSTSSHEGTTFTSFSCIFSGLNLSTTDLNNLEIGIENTANDASVTQVYVVVTYSPAVATFVANEDATLSDFAKLTPIRLRLEVTNNGWSRNTDASRQFRIEYAETATCSSGTYAVVPVTATTEHWEMFDSTNLTDGAATTNVAGGLTDGNAFFVAGQVKDTGNTTSAISITSEQFTELEYSIQATNNATDSGSYCFRVTNAGSAANFTYSSYPEITIVGGTPNVSQLHYRWRNDDGFETTASYASAEDTPFTSGAFVGDRRRLRVLLSNTGTASALNYAYRLEHASSSCTAWIAVPATASGGSHWIMDLSGYVTDELATTDSTGLTNPGEKTFTAGRVKTSSNQASAHTLTSSQFSEFEYSVRSTSVVSPGTTYCFRVTNAGSISNFTYVVTPQISVQANAARPIGGGEGSEPGGSGAPVGGGGAGGGTPPPGEGSGSGTTIGNKTTYTTAGSGTYSVPGGVTSIVVKTWGAGGSGGQVLDSSGGGGGFAQAKLSVTPGETLDVVVGGPADSSAGAAGGFGAGAGGGYSAVKRGATFLVQAGGGGGSGTSLSGGGGGGGAGGGVSGISGSSSGSATGGGGGTSSAGGTAGSPGGVAGSANQGGAGSSGSFQGGGGGGGRFGGGGGGNDSGSNVGAGGGGGSSLVTGTNTLQIAGSGITPGNNTDVDYAGSAGIGAPAGGDSGNPGRVVIIAELPQGGGGGGGDSGFLGDAKNLAVIIGSFPENVIKIIADTFGFIF